MTGNIPPPIPAPIRTSTSNTGGPNANRVDMIPLTNDSVNNTNTTNVSQSVVDENLPQLLDSRGGSHVTNVPAFEKEDFTSWKVRFLVFLDGLEPYLLKTLEDGPFIPMSSLSTSKNPLPKCQNQWSNAESRLANQDKRLKSIMTSCLPNDDSDSDVEEDQRTSNEFMADLNAEFHERALLANQKRFYKSSGRDEESVSSDDEETTKIRAFMVIVEDEPSVGKVDARSGQWVDVTIKKLLGGELLGGELLGGELLGGELLGGELPKQVAV
ncbi:hypothetical protein Tco_1057421 [Tanacetum coccineum]|uniref:Uncharacterized protein n=1 Tax=Tanacetum coccineum TaxID=301880 RepID=A0ABQ5H5K0_9ASTR